MMLQHPGHPIYVAMCDAPSSGTKVNDVEGSQRKPCPDRNGLRPESLFIPALYIISHFGKSSLPARPPGRRIRIAGSFLSPMFTSISAEMENVGNSLNCAPAQSPAALRAKAICDALSRCIENSFRLRRRLAPRTTSLFERRRVNGREKGGWLAEAEEVVAINVRPDI